METTPNRVQLWLNRYLRGSSGSLKLSDIAAHLTNAKNVGRNCHDPKLFMPCAAALSCSYPGNLTATDVCRPASFGSNLLNQK
jgi:hypothetical protein